MKKKKHIYHVYIMINRHHTVLYIGMTGKGLFRIKEHIDEVNPGFTKKVQPEYTGLPGAVYGSNRCHCQGETTQEMEPEKEGVDHREAKS